MPSTALAAERDYIHLVRDDAVTAAVEDLDRRLGEPYGSPVLAGTLERTQCQYTGLLAYIYHGVGHENDITVRFNGLADDEELHEDVRRLMDKVNAKIEQRRRRQITP